MPLARRTLITAAIAAATLGAAPWAHAQADFPTRAVNIVTPFPPGSGPDALLRVITEKLGQLWKQPVVVQNKPGAGGIVAIEATRRLPADGYTLVQFDSEQLVALPLLYISRARDISVLDHFDMVAPIFSTPFTSPKATAGMTRTNRKNRKKNRPKLPTSSRTSIVVG